MLYPFIYCLSLISLIREAVEHQREGEFSFKMSLPYVVLAGGQAAVDNNTFKKR